MVEFMYGNAYGGNPYAQNKDQMLMTLTQGELLIKLFDETVLCMNLAAKALDDKDNDMSHNMLIKLQNIFLYLTNTLEDGFEISTDLKRLYEFLGEQVLQANVRKDRKFLDEILPIVQDMRETWRQADKLSRTRVS